MRDTFKNEEYFRDFIDNRYKSLEKRVTKLERGQINPDRIVPVQQAMASSYLQISSAKYSLGIDSIQKIKADVFRGITLLDRSLIKNNGKVHVADNKYSNKYYIHTYQEILQYLSLAYLLEISDQYFQILVDIIDRDNISDNLYEFIIKARFPERKQDKPEIYEKDSATVKAYDKLRKATDTEDKVEASKLVKQFLEKDFYHKHMNLYNSHKSKANIYCGYWSFEAAAVVKIMDLDDSSFIDNQYYPKDLVHRQEEKPNKKGFLGKLGF
ncbi:MAG: PoNi-like cognate immunity protein [Flavobacteriaceae bacterium]|nr:PoNi-like cognate immunity protein [Flavobacteriaceae bacterium]